jgi:hypothetical protein
MGGIGIFFVVSAVVVLVPVVLQIRLGESRLREVWGYFVFVAGLLVVALADSQVGRGHEIRFALLGVVIALAGLVLQPKNSNTSGRNPS